MTEKDVNLADLYSFYCLGTSASEAERVLEELSVKRPSSEYAPLESLFPDPEEIERSSNIVFSSAGQLLRFYSLLEIALIIKFIPEPSYDDSLWQTISINLRSPLLSEYREHDYPVVLPWFLLGRLDGRLHLEEEAIESNYGRLSSTFLSFASLIQGWSQLLVQEFLRFVLYADESALSAFKESVRTREAFISSVLARDNGDGLIQGLSQILTLCEDLDRLLENSKPFPLLQSAMWNYHADLFWSVRKRLPEYLVEVVESFSEWLMGDDGDRQTLLARQEAVESYIADVRGFIGRLSSGAYGESLDPRLINPLVTA